MQPGYIPWLGFFDLVSRSDVFVIYDNVSFDKGGWRNRNRIKSNTGPLWLTVPVKSHPLHTAISEIEIADMPAWRSKHLKTIKQFYAKAPFFEDFYPCLESILMDEKCKSLLDLNMKLIVKLTDWLGLSTDFMFASALNIREADRVQRLIKIVKHLNGSEFYEPAGGKGYLGQREMDLFKNEGIELVFQNYVHPVYAQLHGDFLPNLSVLDLIFNEGRQSLNILLSKK